MSCLMGNVRIDADAPLQVQLYNAEDGTPLDLSTFDGSWSATGKHATSEVVVPFTGITITDSGNGKMNLEMTSSTFSAGIYDISIKGFETTLSKHYIFPFEQGTFKMRVA